jgi:(p)ppGpp synthase/HD superfamily hydrolase
MSEENTQPVLGERFENALGFAARLHRHQARKGSGIPYVGHLLGVCSLVIEDGGTEDEAIAALLHDAVEDQGGELMLAEIQERFGVEVAAIVEACSDTTKIPKPPWRARKEGYLEHLDSAPVPVLRVSLADKLYNARAILQDLQAMGDVIWKRFNRDAGRDGQLWYSRALAAKLSDLYPSPMAQDLLETVNEIRREALAS